MKKVKPEFSIENALNYFQRQYAISEKNMDEVKRCVSVTHLRKGQTFIIKGRICNKIGILSEGLLYAFYDNKKTGKEITSRFFYLPKNPVVTSFESFHLVLPSNETIKALEDSFLLCFDRESIKHLYSTIPELSEIGRKIAEDSYIMALRRIHSLQALDNKGRIIDCLKNQPELFNRIQRQQLASYLGVNRNAITELL